MIHVVDWLPMIYTLTELQKWHYKSLFCKDEIRRLETTANFYLRNAGICGFLRLGLLLIIITGSRRRHLPFLLVPLLLFHLLVVRFGLGARAGGWRRGWGGTGARWTAVGVRAGTRRTARRTSLLLWSSYNHRLSQSQTEQHHTVFISVVPGL